MSNNSIFNFNNIDSPLGDWTAPAPSAVSRPRHASDVVTYIDNAPQNNAQQPDRTQAFDKDEVVLWLNNTTYPTESPYFMVLPKGLKVIRLGVLRPPGMRYYLCLFWLHDLYHEVRIPASSLVKNHRLLSSSSGQVFRNDISHLLHRVQTYRGRQTEFNQLIDSIQVFYQQPAWSLGKINEGLRQMETTLRTDLEDKPGTIRRFTEAVYEVYNPIEESGTLISEETLILPLSHEWFFSQPSLSSIYESSFPVLHNSLQGDSGSGIKPDDNEFALTVAETLELKRLAEENQLMDSPETTWLIDLPDDFDLQLQRIIFIDDTPWTFTSSDIYASNIALEHSFGPFRMPPVLSVIIHELSVNSSRFLNFAGGTTPDGFGTDPHISVEYTKATWEKASKDLKGLEKVKSTQDFTDHLYQSHRAHAAVALAIIINQISQ